MSEVPVNPQRPAVAADPSARSQVRQSIVEHIQSGRWPAGSRIPTARELAETFETSRSNVHKTIKQLETEGLVERYRRRGTFVSRTATVSRPATRSRLTTARAKVIHLLKPEDGSNDVTLGMPIYQLEETLNHSGYRVDHVPVSPTPTPGDIARVVNRLAGDNAHGLALLANLGVTPDLRCEPTEDPALLLPYVEALRGYPGHICWFNWAGLPLTRWPFDAVSLMPFQEGRIAGDYLLENGVKRAVWVGVEIACWSKMRYDGLCSTLGDKAELASHWYRPYKRDARKPMVDLLHRILDDVVERGDRPTIVPCGDLLGAMLLDIADERGMGCPDDFCVVSFDNADPTCGRNLTTIAPATTKIGGVMAQVLTGQSARPGGGPVHVNLPPYVVERSTFAAADATD